MTTVVNLYGGPGTGKSTTAAALFSLLKQSNIECELVREYAKDVVWEGRTYLLENQIYIFAKQLKRQMDLQGKVDFIITDSPLLLSAVYGKDALLRQLVIQEYGKFDNVDILLERTKPYHPNGRMQTEEEAIALDAECQVMLESLGEKTWFTIAADNDAAERIWWQLNSTISIQDGENRSIKIVTPNTNGLRNDPRGQHIKRWLEQPWPSRRD